MLREQLENVLSEVSGNMSGDLKRSAIFDFVTFKAAGDSTGHSTLGQRHPAMSSLAMLANPAAAEEQAKIVQKDLAALDKEISELQARLEKAAIAKTKNFITTALASSQKT